MCGGDVFNTENEVCVEPVRFHDYCHKSYAFFLCLCRTTILPTVPVMTRVMADLEDFHKNFLAKYA